MWFHPAKELKVYCTINPHKANNLKGLKPLGAGILWSAVGASVLAPAGAGSLFIPPFQLHPGFMAFTPFLCSSVPCSHSPPSLFVPVHRRFHREPPGSCPVRLGVLSDVGTRVFPKILCVAHWGHTSTAAAAPWTGGVRGTCCFRQ